MTSDPWSYFLYRVRELKNQVHRTKGRTLVAHAQEYYLAAQNPRLSSRPVLYYYAFYNLAKAFLLLRGHAEVVDRIARHGLIDPTSAKLGKMPFRNRQVAVRNPTNATDANLLPLFVEDLTGQRLQDRTPFGLLDLLGMLPGIHRTYSRVAKSAPMFCPIERIDLLREKGDYFVRLILDESERDVAHTKSRLVSDPIFSGSFKRVAADVMLTSPDQKELWFETRRKFHGWGAGVVPALKRLRNECLKNAIVPLLTNLGYRYYVALHNGNRDLAGLPAMYMIMFYLGSITRYQPYHFDAMFRGGYRWLVNEFLETQPPQFVYMAASILAETEAVRPFGGSVAV